AEVGEIVSLQREAHGRRPGASPPRSTPIRMTPFARLEHALVWGDVGLDVYADEDAPRPGGCALNVAISLARSGLPRVACAAPLGADGAALREVLASCGVDVTHLELRPGATPRQPVRLAPSGE